MGPNDETGTNEPARDKWANKIEFFLAQIGWAVGYGNVWRFPYKCYQYGGGVFLVPYIISLVFAGVPMYAMELAIGQYSSLGCTQAFAQMMPIMQGVGWAMIVVSALVAIYFNMLISWSIYYLYESFRSPLRWSTCDNDWNTPICRSEFDDENCEKKLGLNGSIWFLKKCINATAIQNTIINVRDYPELENAINTTATGFNISIDTAVEELKQGASFPADEFFKYGALVQSDSIDDMGTLQPHLVACQAIAWALVFCCISFGVKSVGKIVYVTATVPYLLITCLLIRGVTLTGASDGLYFYLFNDISIEKLADAEVWKAAAVQIFYTYGVAFGVIITYASYNDFHSNSLCDAYKICLTDSCTSFYTGFAVFSTAGFIANKINREVPNIIRGGEGLGFVVFAEAVARMPWPNFWAVLFFAMMVLIGIDSQFPMVEVPATAFMDEFPILRKYKPLVFLTFCIIGFLIGLPLCMNGGIYWFTLINDYSAGYCLLVISICEVLTAMYLYGFRNFVRDVEMMIGSRPMGIWAYWLACWMVITPIYLSVICFFSLYEYSPSVVNDKKLPDWAQTCGWAMSIVSIICIPIWAVYRLGRAICTGQPIMSVFRPTAAYTSDDLRKRDQAPLARLDTALSPVGGHRVIPLEVTHMKSHNF